MSSPLSAFTAVPNPQMLAFMGTQSFIMMYQAGEGWQYGKRKQSAMSNEEFNKQTPLSIMDRQRQELINALPSIADSMNAMTPLISTIVKQYGDFISEAIKAVPETVANATQSNPFLAFGDTGNTTQKQFQTNNPNTIDGLIKAFTILANGISKGGLVSHNQVGPTPSDDISFTGPPPPPPPPPSGGILGNLEIHKSQVDTSLKNKATLESFKTQASEGALRRKSIADSGLSPLAFNARETFRENIDQAVRVLASAVELINRDASRNWNSASAKLRKADGQAKAQIRTKKLSALRIKYFQVYGEHY